MGHSRFHPLQFKSRWVQGVSAALPVTMEMPDQANPVHSPLSLLRAAGEAAAPLRIRTVQAVTTRTLNMHQTDPSTEVVVEHRRKDREVRGGPVIQGVMEKGTPQVPPTKPVAAELVLGKTAPQEGRKQVEMAAMEFHQVYRAPL